MRADNITAVIAYFHSRTIILFKNCMKKSLLVALLFAISMGVNMELPKMVRTTHKGISLPALNVTIGEKFSLPLPLFDTPWQQ